MSNFINNLENKVKLSDNTKKALLLGTVFLIIFVLTLHSLVDYDFWFHYDCGRYIAINHNIPDTAISSWYGIENNLPWISHEWAFGLLCYYIANIVGLKGLPFIASLAMSSLVTFIAYKNIKRSIKHPMITVVMTVFLSLSLIGATVVRPHILLYVFTVALYLILERELNSPSNKIYWLIPLTILWVNLHGGSFILLFFFAGLFFFLDAIKFRMGRIKFKGADKKTTIKRFIVLVVSLACVALNAHGLEMYSYPFSNMGDTVMLETIVEWQPLNLGSFQLVFLILPIIYFAMVVSRDEDIDGYSFIFMLALTAMSLKSVRFAVQLNLITVYLLAKNIRVKDKHATFSYIVTLPVIIVALFGYLSGNVQKVANEPFDKTSLPSDIVIEAVRNDKADRLYNHYNVGGYLTYLEIPVFIDGRADIYSKHNTLDFKKMSDCEYGFEDTLNKYDFDGFLVYKAEKLADYLSKNDNYELKVEDDVFAYYVKGLPNNG